MWLLVIVLLAAPIGIRPVTVLNTFETYEDCKPERDRVGFAMAESYPYENTFRIVCQLQEQQPSIRPIRYERDEPHPVTLVFSQLVATGQTMTADIP
ncbi:MAG: hypothetical protein K2Q17_11080 [Nitrospiraceae bacterium]|jgi:hypothetical protein|uniref:hypothetical protein n=1 Tax=Nitrospira cf. moscoviensis SBR1015 TaxID=96242 RepID=UPI000A0B6A10|nr:hypothetical protein [Nitrospira cf. moscoviensis SBR1015]MBY0248198.1 hypothetical protein [Nitrospiraceae bacterium]OQW35159.1 MAG: hypothetical protein A4E20_09800 [Nitrospira sp. SG-bin2]